ncbi:hypothetical protein ElyMa_007004900 [Elysia marginata]|uniref:C2H2-type domain-containing protein n=1 Tax=Elysia marginata TaxID=1093978 RepID=A0AAV4JS17_9GAST|nr:hypothetical protein ElyMa_007004900 [Elysia marginata]
MSVRVSSRFERFGIFRDVNIRLLYKSPEDHQNTALSIRPKWCKGHNGRGRPNTTEGRAGSTEIYLGSAIEGDKVVYLLPIPGHVTCDLCRPHQTWRRKTSRHRDAPKHLQENHHPGLVANFRCTTCGFMCTTLHAGNRHLSRS